MGQDAYGLWVRIDLSLDEARPVSQRLRWIPPGRFLMGSPEDEPGRYEDEGPQHEVTFEKGFWLFDTPCTQALWQAVMGDNPSRFKSPDRPVEQVDFQDVRKFLKKINKEHAGLNLILPSEAQWEYACRAGTTTALYSGPIEIKGENNAPALDPIAWYGGNSGEEFDLDNGWDISGLLEKQYPHKKAGTHRVALKKSNPWGLYDMLGNVCEWCADPWHASYEGAPTDGSVWEAPGDRRVLRGGSWFAYVRDVRAASRGPLTIISSQHLGFRCARVQE
ncbi:MAG: formylglycine-generating enzyme family protein [Magnetococcales bacterium]|nr:formylglycine-generating enzyme family protein [Magnetococcales bacterium]